MDKVPKRKLKVVPRRIKGYKDELSTSHPLRYRPYKRSRHQDYLSDEEFEDQQATYSDSELPSFNSYFSSRRRRLSPSLEDTISELRYRSSDCLPSKFGRSFRSSSPIEELGRRDFFSHDLFKDSHGPLPLSEIRRKHSWSDSPQRRSLLPSLESQDEISGPRNFYERRSLLPTPDTREGFLPPPLPNFESKSGLLPTPTFRGSKTLLPAPKNLDLRTGLLPPPSFFDSIGSGLLPPPDSKGGLLPLPQPPYQDRVDPLPYSRKGLLPRPEESFSLISKNRRFMGSASWHPEPFLGKPGLLPTPPHPPLRPPVLPRSRRRVHREDRSHSSYRTRPSTGLLPDPPSHRPPLLPIRG